MSTTITGIVARDVRFPTSENLDGSDAMNQAPDYSAAYVVLETDSPEGLEGHGRTIWGLSGVGSRATASSDG